MFIRKTIRYASPLARLSHPTAVPMRTLHTTPKFAAFKKKIYTPQVQNSLHGLIIPGAILGTGLGLGYIMLDMLNQRLYGRSLAESRRLENENDARIAKTKAEFLAGTSSIVKKVYESSYEKRDDYLFGLTAEFLRSSIANPDDLAKILHLMTGLEDRKLLLDKLGGNYLQNLITTDNDLIKILEQLGDHVHVIDLIGDEHFLKILETKGAFANLLTNSNLTNTEISIFIELLKDEELRKIINSQKDFTEGLIRLRRIDDKNGVNNYFDRLGQPHLNQILEPDFANALQKIANKHGITQVPDILLALRRCDQLNADNLLRIANEVNSVKQFTKVIDIALHSSNKLDAESFNVAMKNAKKIDEMVNIFDRAFSIVFKDQIAAEQKTNQHFGESVKQMQTEMIDKLIQSILKNSDHIDDFNKQLQTRDKAKEYMGIYMDILNKKWESKNYSASPRLRA